MAMKFNPTDVCRMFLFVREAGPNTGSRVEAIQRWGSGKAGDSWCCFFATMILDICFQGRAPIPRLGAVQDVYNLAKKNNWLVDIPKKEDIFIYVNDQDHAHHIGFVTADGGGDGIAGNTSIDGKSSNGNGVYEHAVSKDKKHVKYIRFPRM